MEALGFGDEIARGEAEPGELFVVLGREIELQAPPAFLAQAHVTAARVEEQLGFLRREHEVGHVEDDFEIEPVNARLLHVEGHGAADGRIAERGEFAVELDGDVRRETLQPRDEQLGRLPGEPDHPAAVVVGPFAAERLQHAGKVRLRRAVVNGDEPFHRLGGFDWAPALIGRLPAVAGRTLPSPIPAARAVGRRIMDSDLLPG